jgi:hypothetical protein
MKTAFWQANLTASQAGENGQTNGLEHTIESSILTDLIHRKTAEEVRYCKKHTQTSEEVQFNQCISKFNRHSNCINFNINFDLELSRIKDETDV